MTEAKHTPGPWSLHPVDDTSIGVKGADGEWLEVANVGGDYNQPETWPVMEANARLICAAPDLIKVAQNIEVKGPDADAVFWLVLHGHGMTAKAMFRLGSIDLVAVQAMCLFEEDRRAAIAKARGEAA